MLSFCTLLLSKSRKGDRNEKKKTVKTRMLSLFLVLLLLTGSVSSVRAEEAAGTEAAGSETTKEQIVESEESVGSGEQGSVPGSAESTEAGQKAEEIPTQKNRMVPQLRRKTKRHLLTKMHLISLL